MRFIAGALLVLLALSCRSEESAPVAPDSAGLQGREWKLVELGGQPVATPAEFTSPFITFEADTPGVTGNTGCNSFFGGVDVSGASMLFGVLGSTRRACPDPIADVERRFLQALGETRTWRIEGSQLLLLSGDTVLARLR